MNVYSISEVSNVPAIYAMYGGRRRGYYTELARLPHAASLLEQRFQRWIGTSWQHVVLWKTKLSTIG